MTERPQPRAQASGVHSADERAQRRVRVEAAKDALQRSAKLDDAQGRIEELARRVEAGKP